MPTTPEALVAALDRWAGQILQRSAHDMSAFSHAHGLSVSQLNVLMWFYHHGPSEVSALCDRLAGVSKAAASQMVDRMVQENLVERREAVNDRRVRLVCLTEHGRELAHSSLALRTSWLGQVVSGLSPSEQAQIQASISLLLNATEPSTLEV